MADQYLASLIDPTRCISFDTATLLTTSTINALHFPDLSTSGISDSGGGRTTSFLLDGVGMCESMTESFCSTGAQDDTMLLNNTNTLQSDTSINNSLKLERKDSTTQRKRRSRKAQYDASIDGASFDKIETVILIDEQNEPDDAWLYEVSKNGHKNNPTDNIFSWVHKEFKTNDINANKHRLLCKLDDMSHARTIRSISCHNFADNQKSDSVKRSSTEQQVNSGITIEISTNNLIENILYLNELFTLTSSLSSSLTKSHLSTISIDSIEKDDDQLNLFNDESSYDIFLLKNIIDERQIIEKLTQQCSSLENFDYNTKSSSKPIKNGRLSSPLRAVTPVLNERNNIRPMSPAILSPLHSNITGTYANGNYTNNNTVTNMVRSREASRERLDYTDLEVMAKVQLENLRQAERQGPLSKHLGGSNVSLASTNSGTTISMSSRTGTKPPVAPKSTLTRNGVKTNNYHRSNTQTITANATNGYDIQTVNQSKSSVTSTTRASVLPPNSANNNRTRPPAARPIQPYRGSQTTYNNNNNNNNAKVQVAPSSVQRNGKKPANNFGSTFTSKELPLNENGLLNDVSNKPLTVPIRSQVGPQRRTIVPQSSIHSSVEQIPPTTSSSVDTITNGQTNNLRSSSSLSQGRKSGIPTVGKQQKPSTATVTRPTSSKLIPYSQSSDSMMVTRNIRTQKLTAYRPTADTTTSWNDGCY